MKNIIIKKRETIKHNSKSGCMITMKTTDSNGEITIKKYLRNEKIILVNKTKN
jgi:hypothetical protein